MTTPYTVKKALARKPVVVYPCPACKAELESPLEKAGTEDQCPECRHRHQVPGTKELVALKAEDRGQQALREDASLLQETLKAEAKAKKRRELAAQQEHERKERERVEAERQKRAAAQALAGDGHRPSGGLGLIIESFVLSVLGGFILLSGFASVASHMRAGSDIADMDMWVIFAGALICLVAVILLLAGVIRLGVSGAEFAHLSRIEQQNQTLIQLLEGIHRALAANSGAEQNEPARAIPAQPDKEEQA